MTLENNLHYEKVIHLDLNKFTAVTRNTSVRDTIAKMKEGANHTAIVTENGALIGIFTDRDILRRVVDAPETWDQAVESVMTPSPITVNSSDAADKALGIMDKNHFRNVPVVNDKGRVIGNLTHYAVIKYLADHFPESVYNLPPDPNQVTSNRDGA